jgi:hypothetical protein
MWPPEWITAAHSERLPRWRRLGRLLGRQGRHGCPSERAAALPAQLPELEHLAIKCHPL